MRSEAWEKIGYKNHHGICTPLSSIYTKHSCGIGEILDLLPLIDWVKEVGFDTVQLLPINDSGSDNSPYNILSSCAINPVYLSLHALPYLNEAPHLKISLATFKESPPYVDYKKVREKKELWLKLYFDQFQPLIEKDPDYRLFLEAQRWVASYSHFIAPETSLSEERIQMIQFFLIRQLKQVKKYAAEKGVILIGDIPILVSKESVDAWTHQNLFDTKDTVGVPPDLFSETGQSWGFPYFKWEEDRETAFRLWKRKLQLAENFYHGYRLDHIVGFFRLWKIPEGKKASEGHYIPDSVQDAVERGNMILEELISFTDMLPIGEDLGVVLPEFKQVVKSLSIPGMKVMRWERYWHSGGGFIPVENYEPLNLTCVSTHDTETLEQWWNRHPDEASLYCQLKGISYRPLDRELRTLYLRDAHHSGSLFHVNLFNEYLALYPELVHDYPYEERINIPGTQPEENWRYRLRLPLEKTLSHEGLKSAIRTLIA